MSRTTEPGAGADETRRELERALSETDSSEGRYHIRQAMQLLEAED